MRLKGKASIKYSVKGKVDTIEVVTKLVYADFVNERKNVWMGVAKVNDYDYTYPGSENYVDAQFLAEDILELEIKKLKEKFKSVKFLK